MAKPSTSLDDLKTQIADLKETIDAIIASDPEDQEIISSWLGKIASNYANATPSTDSTDGTTDENGDPTDTSDDSDGSDDMDDSVEAKDKKAAKDTAPQKGTGQVQMSEKTSLELSELRKKVESYEIKLKEKDFNAEFVGKKIFPAEKKNYWALFLKDEVNTRAILNSKPELKLSEEIGSSADVEVKDVNDSNAQSVFLSKVNEIKASENCSTAKAMAKIYATDKALYEMAYSKNRLTDKALYEYSKKGGKLI